MALPPASVPPAAVPLTQDGKIITNPWRRFLEALYARSGGAKEISVTATSNTNLRFSYRGTDGVVRTGDLTVS